jgi:hypothetical protein
MAAADPQARNAKNGVSLMHAFAVNRSTYHSIHVEEARRLVSKQLIDSLIVISIGVDKLGNKLAISSPYTL